MFWNKYSSYKRNYGDVIFLFVVADTSSLLLMCMYVMLKTMMPINQGVTVLNNSFVILVSWSYASCKVFVLYWDEYSLQQQKSLLVDNICNPVVNCRESGVWDFARIK